MQNTDLPQSEWMALQVKHKAEIAQGIFAFELARAAGSELPAFDAGSHITVQTPSGARRNYSLHNAPGETHRYCIAVKRDAAGRGGSVSMADSLQEGQTLQVRAPENAFALHPRARHFLFIAGGIGITPIMAMVQQVLAMPDATFKLVYCTRDAASTAFLAQLQGADYAGKVTVRHDHGDIGQAFDFWPLLEKPQSGTHIYCCGPRGLMDAVKDMSGHWPFGTVHFESFGVDSTLRQSNQAFDVVLARTGQSIQVGKDSSILEALRAQGIAVRSSCESGTCGSCKTALVSGVCEHRDYVLSDDEKSSHIMVCVSRAAAGSHLVLGL